MSNASGLSLLTLNIANPSAQRAERQLAWLASRDEDVFVLTETKASEGCRLLANAFRSAGYAVMYPEPEPGEYGSMIISRVHAEPHDFGTRIGYLPARAAAAILPTPYGALRVLGIYAPSRDASVEKTERKKKWLAAFLAALGTEEVPRTILLGDLNILEPDHQPHYSFFAQFEYDFYRALLKTHGLLDAFRHLHPNLIEHSWVGRTRDGYRYDHALCSTSLKSHIAVCEYIHQPRLERLSDHSALTMRLTGAAPPPLQTSEILTPTTAPTLF
jgi:exodeoxyribonuclease-3